MDFVRAIKREGKSAIYISHNIYLLYPVCERFVLLDRGKVVREFQKSEISKDKLTEEEYEIVKRHPLIGEKIIAPVKFLENVAPLVLYHHEHYDGHGYLDGLKDDEIPVGARIICVADSFDAMTSDRPYRKALKMEEAKEELRKKKGTQFDPKIVDILLGILEREEG